MYKFIFALIFTVSSQGFAAAAPKPPIPNLKRVSAAVYRGGRPTAEGLRMLKDLGIKTDINLQGGDLNSNDPYIKAFMTWWEPGETAENIQLEKTAVENLQMTFFPAPLQSNAAVTNDEDAAIDRILALMNDSHAQPVFVHCEFGKDRTGLIIALYEIKFMGKSITEAHDEWVAGGHKGVGAYFTGKLDEYFYKKAALILAGL